MSPLSCSATIFASIIDFGSALLVAVYLYHHTFFFYPVVFGEIMPKGILRPASPAFLQEGCQRYIVSAQVVLASRNDIAPQWYTAREGGAERNHVLSVDDLEQALELTDKNDIRNEQKMLQGIIRFGDETAKEIMTSRQDVVDPDFRCTFRRYWKCIVTTIIVVYLYIRTIPTISGVSCTSDLLPHLQTVYYSDGSHRWYVPPYFVPETKKIDDLRASFGEQGYISPSSLIEFGGTSGIGDPGGYTGRDSGWDQWRNRRRENYVRLNQNTYLLKERRCWAISIKYWNWTTKYSEDRRRRWYTRRTDAWTEGDFRRYTKTGIR